jgi:hypothetical protein
MSRAWAMPNIATFTIAPIRGLLGRWIKPDMHGCDPFARNSKWAAITNDLNPDTSAMYHRDALEFLRTRKDVEFDFVLLDPPFSSEQVKRNYENIGRAVFASDTHRQQFMRQVKDETDRVLKPGGLVLCFAWDSGGMGIGRGYDRLETLIVAHGGVRNDTICVVDRKPSVAE